MYPAFGAPGGEGITVAILPWKPSTKEHREYAFAKPFRESLSFFDFCIF